MQRSTARAFSTAGIVGLLAPPLPEGPVATGRARGAEHGTPQPYTARATGLSWTCCRATGARRCRALRRPATAVHWPAALLQPRRDLPPVEHDFSGPPSGRGCAAPARAAGASFRERRQLRHQAERAAEREPALREAFDRLAAPERQRIATELPQAKTRLAELKGQHWGHVYFEITYPDALRRAARP
ncbi:MAG: hypothetical protein M3Q29_12210 [Chloroflexota bacterium]|nr:hypothetical protein [Chloroflexota bacterium]